MDLASIKNEMLKKLENAQNAEILGAINALPKFDCEVSFGDAISAKFDANEEQMEQIRQIALSLKPWRKGPFALNELFIDSEWQSFIKFNLLRGHIDLAGKNVADVGCNNGYYMYRMLGLGARSVTGFDPSALFYLQFLFLQHFMRTQAIFEPLGVEHLPFYGAKFDTIFCLGVIYHRSDPISMLKQLKSALNSGGEVILDTMYIDMDGDFALTPKGGYSKISNIYFVPTIGALSNWCERAKFKNFEILETKQTDFNEQRKTEWIDGQSLENFLDPKNPNLTIEGYPAPKRVYVKISL
ncbi:tRNA 5-methoxyuridine(34)/uridine 5-oxyacetic acid(34) synthase CmoB [Campylobacter sp. VBCF_06 NA8]|uniref:tRNA 5-methoxyuridine(34)/uridine 5-oxyacetic acid(34) synthase CmoB n=1 Tax=Campylobacter sp. VBCF_06 NA8 TaxID=2983822 RepID=UPI003FA43D66